MIAHMFDYHRAHDGTTAEHLAELVATAPGPPMVTAQTSTGQSVPAALLAWGHADTGWMAGIAFLSGSGQRHAIITMWAASSSVHPVSGMDYRQVPRVRLAGQPEVWPHLPPRYPYAKAEWTATHLHLARRDRG